MLASVGAVLASITFHPSPASASSGRAEGPAASPTLLVSPASGPVGTLAAAEGTGFPASSKVTVTWSFTSTSVCSALAQSSGTFECEFVVPASPSGARSLTAANGSTAASTSFTVVPELTANPTSGPAGTSVTFNATGFDASAALDVAWQGGTVLACTGRTNGDGGSPSCTYVIPAGTTTGGPYPFTARDVNGSSASVNFTVTYTPRLEVSPTSGTVGTVVTITGSEFAAGTSVTVTWDSAATVACTEIANSTGSFSCPFTVPSGPEGIQTLTGVDPDSGTGVAVFALVAGPAPTPSSTTGGGFLGLSAPAAYGLVAGLVAWGGIGTFAAVWYGRGRRPPRTAAPDRAAPNEPPG